jgi:cobalt-precorrin 5A hydrolase / precorrin-3B C17-methyltransferase
MKPPAIAILGANSLPVARKIQHILPEARIYGLINRTHSVDVTYANFGDTIRELWANNTPIIGICAAGILIRTLAPLISDKRQEPPVLAIAEDGSAVVPLLGGLQGVNNLARQIAAGLQVLPAITTTGDIRFQTALLSPPAGYYLANPEDAKTFISDLLAGESLVLEGIAPWLSQSQLPIASTGKLKIRVTERLAERQSNTLIYHPKTVAIGIDGRITTNIAEAIAKAEISPHAIAGIFASRIYGNHPAIEAISTTFNIPPRFFEDLDSASEVALKAVGATGKIVVAEAGYTIAIALQPLEIEKIGHPQGKLAIVGTGAGSLEWMSPEVKNLLLSATDWVGYTTYLNLVEPLRQSQKRHDSDNRVELDRARLALDLAVEGRSVALISSGDPGIFAMAAAVFEVLERENKPEWQQIKIQVAPGISAVQAAASRIGAPIGHDFCLISLSDILKPWEIIEKRIAAAAQADFVIAFYNPVSKQRTWQLERTREILLQWRSPDTPVVLAKNVGRQGESVQVRSLSQLSAAEVDMRTLVLVGSSQTRAIEHPQQIWVYTPRRYEGVE